MLLLVSPVLQGPLLGSQVPPPPQPGSSTAVKARPAAGIPAVFPQRLEAKLAAALSPGPLAEHSSASLSRPRSPSQPSPSSQASSLSSMTTPSTAGSLDSLPSSWGLHASRKLRKLVRHQQRLGRMAPGGQVGEAPGILCACTQHEVIEGPNTRHSFFVCRMR